MGFVDETGASLNKTQLTALFTQVEDDPVLELDPDKRIMETYYQAGENIADGPGGRRLRFTGGTQLRQSEINALFPDATIATVSPGTGLAAGGTQVVITGTNFTYGSQVTFGGTAATGEAVNEDGTEITCVAPAHTAATVNVAVITDAGTFTKTNAYIYT